MRKNLMVAAAGLLVLALPAANAFGLGRLTLGVKGGLNSSNLRISSDTTVSTFQSIGRLAWGGFIGYRITNLIGIQAEVLNSAKGAHIRESIGGVPVETTLKYDYTEVPLLITFSEKGEGQLTPMLFAGPYIAFLNKAEGTFITGGQEVTEPLADQKDKDFGFVFGASLRYRLGVISLVGDLRYDLGLADVDKAAGSTFNQRVISIMVGLAF
jgi:hypothetical protein